MTRVHWFAAAMWALVGSGCVCTQLPNAVFACEPDGGCGGQEGFVCGADSLCRMPRDGGGLTPDAGPLDAGTRADSGSAIDSGVKTDAGSSMSDAGPLPVDAGAVDSGAIDSGMPGDSGPGPVDAGPPPCVPTADEPDDTAQQGVDTNCDGIDGDLSIAALVDTATGNDSTGNGSLAAPFKTIGRALATMKPQILISQGTYAENVIVTAARLFGGYDRSANWARTGSRPSIEGTVEVVGLTGNVTLDFVRVVAPPTTAASVTVIVTDADSGTIIRRSVLIAARGQDGANGSAPFDGSNGAGGNPGASSADGGAGGALVVSSCANATLSTNGGSGGSAPRAYVGGEPGQPAGMGGDGGVAYSCSFQPCEGFAGAAGLSGGNGGQGGSASAAVMGTFNETAWFAPVAPSGTAGQPGEGGGGAGAGGALHDETGATYWFGGGGGSGGSGGCGGLGGMGGRSGAASVSLLLVRASPTLEANELETGNGGAGGHGALGANGGLGGAGALGGAGDSSGDGKSEGARGGRGGGGGRGGSGGRGGGGSGGPSAGVWCTANSAPVFVGTANSYVLGLSGSGGQPNGAPGTRAERIGCP